MLVTDHALLAGRDLVEVCRTAARGGVTSIQLRLQHTTPRRLLQELRRLQAAVDLPVLVNDRLDVAIAGGAAGVHLGPDDVPVDLARRVAPPGLIIGASVGTDAEVENGRAADYWGIGPFRATGTKADAGAALGGAGFSHLVNLAGRDRCCVAVGGVRPEDVPDILRWGGTGVAVVSGILSAEDLEGAARRYASALTG